MARFARGAAAKIAGCVVINDNVAFGILRTLELDPFYVQTSNAPFPNLNLLPPLASAQLNFLLSPGQKSMAIKSTYLLGVRSLNIIEKASKLHTGHNYLF